MLPKRFLYVTEVDLSEDNGPGINEREFVNALMKVAENEVVCLVPYPRNPKIHFEPRLVYIKNPRCLQGKVSWVSYFVFLMSSFNSIVALHGRHGFSLLAFRLGKTSIIPMLVSRFLKLPLALKTFARYPSSLDWLNWKGRLIDRLLLVLDRLTINKMIVADTVSIPHRDWLCLRFDIPKEKLVIVPNGVNASHFSPGSQRVSRRRQGLGYFEKIIGYVGALTAIRHLDLLVMSFKNIGLSRNAGLVIIGDGAARSRLEAIAREQGMEDRVIFRGFVCYRDIPDYMRCFDVAVDLSIVPIRIGKRIFASSYSQKVPQYLACGLPVVAWDVAEYQFLKEERIGDLVPFRDEALLENSLQKLLDLKPDEREMLSARARSYATRNFSVEVLAERRKEMWLRALESKVFEGRLE